MPGRRPSVRHTLHVAARAKRSDVAQRTHVVLISDLSGNEIKNGGESISFSYRGADYTIDLSAKEAEAFDKAIAVYIEHGQKQRGGSGTCVGTTRAAPTGSTSRRHASGFAPTATR
jgi:hypothetical protein